MTSFFLAGALEQVKSSPTMKLHDLIDWPAIESKLVGLYKREASGAGGPDPYRPLSMFKLVLLGQWHKLSDAQMEQALRVRLDFLVFCEFDLGAELPDHTTICRFRNRLIKAKLDETLLAEINGQLAHKGLKVNEARGAIIDASIVESAARPNRVIDLDQDGKASVCDSADKDARWVKQGNAACYKVEQCFGALKRRFHLDRSRYFGLRRTEAQLRWASIGFNLLKAQRKLERLHAQALAC